jgi:hypothetical protein
VSDPSSDRTPRGAEGSAYRPFRPRAARVVSLVLAVAVLGMMILIAATLPRLTGGPATVSDRVGIAGFGVAVAWFLYRESAVRAMPDPAGMTVRNLVVTTRVSWAEVVSVRFGPDRPWVQLDLADGQTLAVMAVQRADGRRAADEARRMATLVARHSATDRDD